MTGEVGFSRKAQTQSPVSGLILAGRWLWASHTPLSTSGSHLEMESSQMHKKRPAGTLSHTVGQMGHCFAGEIADKPGSTPGSTWNDHPETLKI